MLLGYARAGTAAHTLESQIDALTDAGVEPARIYSDVFAAITRMQRRPGFTALLDYARPGDITVVVGIDRLGRSAPEVMATARDLTERQIGLRSLREGLDTDDPAGAMIVGVLASLAELDEELRPDRAPTVSSRRNRGPSVGRPRALGDDQIAVAERMRAEGQPMPTIAAALGVSRATLYRTLAERRSA
ncbi:MULTISPECIES: recombinase family protein [Gordonia]|uniref:Recombinase family protein n=1 Tax=Gordonia tangerina TaxID=2911060 RepID=A0ABS9DK56_9ACTN|nr:MULTISPECIES: recombinase family protein [Gordonia]MAU84947.1 resolvase [Gordonia sp. (in: high G+C Gram-positive bacteria)]MCF3939527.1 recombinase family protein [Gordonia tangerina]